MAIGCLDAVAKVVEQKLVIEKVEDKEVKNFLKTLYNANRNPNFGYWGGKILFTVACNGMAGGRQGLAMIVNDIRENAKTFY